MKYSNFIISALVALLSFSSLAQPANNTCAGAITLPVTNGSCSSIAYTNVGATTAGNPPTPGCWSPNSMSHTVWFNFVAPSTSVEISTNFGFSLTNSQIAVYSGTCGALTLIGCNEDINTGAGLFHTNLQLHGLTVGNTYYIIVDGNGTSTGQFGVCVQEILPISPPLPIQDCPTAQFLCNTNSITVPNGTGGPGLIQERPSCFGDPGERASWWYSFTAANNGTLCFNIVPTTGTDFDFAVFNTTNGCLGTQLACNWWGSTGTTGLGCGGAACNACITLTAGQTYTILVDRFTASSASGFTLNFTGTATFASPNPSFTSTVACLGSPTQFTNTTLGSNTYSWNFGDGTTSSQQNPSHTYASAGTYTASLLVTSNPGGCQNIVTNTVTVNPLPTVNAGSDVTICSGTCTDLSGTSSVSPSSSSTPFSNSTVVSIPNNNTSGANTSVTVSGAVSPNCTLQSVCFTLNHGAHSDIGYTSNPNAVTITMPNGTVYNSTITPLAAFNGTRTYCIPLSVFSGYTGSLNGTWILNVKDSRAGGGSTGSITNFTVTTSCNSIVWTPTTNMTNANTLTPTVCPTTSTTYTLTALGAGGCSASDQVLVNVVAEVIPVFTQLGPYCQGATPGTLPTTSNNGLTGVWSPSTISTVSSGLTTYTFTPNPGQCGAITTMDVQVNPTPTVDDPANQILCAGNNTVAVNFTGNNASTTYNWTNNNTSIGLVAGGSGNIPSFTTLNSGTTPQIATINVTPVLGACTGTAQTFTITVNPIPVITLNPSPLSACNATDGEIEVVLLSGATSSGTVNWTGIASGTSGVTTLPYDMLNLGAGNYNVTFTDANGCTSASVGAILDNPGAPSINAIADYESCNVPFTLLESNITGTGLTGNQGYFSAPNGGGSQYPDGFVFPVGTNNVLVYVYDVSGLCAAEISFLVTVNTNPTASITPDPAVVCEGASIVLNGNPSGGSGIYSHSWTGDVSLLNSTSVVNPSTLTTATFGTYNLTYTVTDDNGCIGSNIIAVSVNQTPELTVSNPTAVCSPATVDITASSVSSTTVGSLTYFADPGFTTPVADPTAVGDGTYYVVAANGTCTDNGSVTVTVTETPVLTLIPPAAVCSPATVDITSVAVTSTTVGTLAYYTDATLTTLVADPTAVGDGTYYVVAANGACIDDGSVLVQVTQTPFLTTNEVAAVCFPLTIDLTDPVVIDGSANIGSLNYFDTDGVTPLVSPSAVSVSGTYYIQAVNGVCTAFEEVIVTINESPVLTLIPPAAVCSPSTVDITAASVTSTTIGTLAYYTDATFTTLVADPTAVGAGMYYVVATNGLCTDDGSVTVTVTGTPVLTLNPPAAVCSPATVDITNPAVSSTTAGTLTYYTDAAFTSPVADATAVGAGTYYVVATSGTCSDDGSLTVTINTTPSITDLVDQVACNSYDLPTITGSDLNAAAYYNNSQALGGTAITGPITSTQTVWIYDANGTCLDETSFLVTITPLPTVTGVSGGATYCQGDVVTPIEVAVTGTADWTIEYTLNGVAQTATGSASPINLGNAAGVYTLTGVTDAGCTNTASGTQTIVVNVIPDTPTAGNDSTYCSAWTLVPMTATGTGGTMTWYSSTGSVLGTGNSFTPLSGEGTTLYYVTETLLGCEGASSEVMITINVCDITTPTAFTPDGDGVNETWQIVDLDIVYPDNVVRVYNRWGNLIYEHDSSVDGPYSSNEWDGTYKGEALPVGSYYFAIEFNNDDKDSSTGTVSILKK
jgi:gliding motility-associated-like protein